MASALCDEIKANAMRGDSEQYDLAGFSPAWLKDLVDGCLGQTLPAKTYVACKFIIGGGKKTRAKYDPDMLKHLSEALRGAGLEEDRGASACEQCQGMYKYQHDTDKDLKYLHVFPRVSVVRAGDDGASAADAGGVEDRSPEMQCVSCSFEEFRDLVAMNVPSFSQKRALLKRMKVMTAALEQLEQMLVEQKSLTEQEQEMYDAMVDVSDKVEYLNKELEKMVAKGRLTKGEQKQMMDDFAKKMEELDVMSAAAEAEGKAKRRDALLAKKDEIADKANAVAECKPIVYTVAHEKEMNDLAADAEIPIEELMRRYREMEAAHGGGEDLEEAEEEEGDDEEEDEDRGPAVAKTRASRNAPGSGCRRSRHPRGARDGARARTTRGSVGDADASARIVRVRVRSSEGWGSKNDERYSLFLIRAEPFARKSATIHV